MTTSGLYWRMRRTNCSRNSPGGKQGQFQVGVFQKDGRLSAQDGSRARRLLPADRGQRLRAVLKASLCCRWTR